MRSLGPREASDEFITASDGQQYWGRFGAAGALLVAPSGRILVQRRAAWTHQGGTWSIPGGARRLTESVIESSLRELSEEVILPTSVGRLCPVGTSVLDRGGWTYTTVIMRAESEVEAKPDGRETDDLLWISPSEVLDLELHPGLAEAWPSVSEMLAIHPVIVGVPEVPVPGLRAVRLGLPGSRWFPEVVTADQASSGSHVIWVGERDLVFDALAAERRVLGPFAGLDALL